MDILVGKMTGLERTHLRNIIANVSSGLYTDESPGLKVDPVVVLVLSLVFIFSVVALHSTNSFPFPSSSFRVHGADKATVIAKITRRFSS